MKKVEELQTGEVLINSVRKISGDKYQLEFAEKIQNPTSRENVLALVNAGDERFTQSSGARRAWLTGTALGFKSTFNIDCTNVGETPVMLGILSPKLPSGVELHIEIVETVTPTDYQKANIEKSAKQNGKGKFFMYNGNHIFSNTTIVAGVAKHKLLKITDESGAYLPQCGLVEFGAQLTTTPALDVANLG